MLLYPGQCQVYAAIHNHSISSGHNQTETSPSRGLSPTQSQTSSKQTITKCSSYVLLPFTPFLLTSYSPTHTLTHAHTHPRTHSPMHTLTHAHTHPHTHSPTHTLTHAHTHPHTHSPTHTLTHKLTHAVTHPCKHSLMHTLTHARMHTHNPPSLPHQYLHANDVFLGIMVHSRQSHHVDAVCEVLQPFLCGAGDHLDGLDQGVAWLPVQLHYLLLVVLLHLVDIVGRNLVQMSAHNDDWRVGGSCLHAYGARTQNKETEENEGRRGEEVG